MASLFSYLRFPFYAFSAISALGGSLLYFKQNDLIYPRYMPSGARTEVPTPAQFHIDDAESIHLRTPDGQTLHAYLLRAPTSPLRKNITMLLFHGNAGNIGHRLPIGKVLSQNLGCDVFMLEYRGYGLSTGDPDEDGLTIDAHTGLDYIRERAELKNNKLVVYGQSLGGAVAIKLVEAEQHKEDIAGVILENTFTSIPAMIPMVFPAAKPLARLCHQLWKSDETLPKITAKIPFLFLSGLKDEIVPAQMMRTLYESCEAEIKIWKTFENGMHNSTVAEPGYFDAIWEFVAQEIESGGAKEKNLHVGSAALRSDELWS